MLCFILLLRHFEEVRLVGRFCFGAAEACYSESYQADGAADVLGIEEGQGTA